MNYNSCSFINKLINYYFTIFNFELYITINCTANTEAKIFIFIYYYFFISLKFKLVIIYHTYLSINCIAQSNTVEYILFPNESFGFNLVIDFGHSSLSVNSDFFNLQ